MTEKKLEEMTVKELITYDTGDDPCIPLSCGGRDELIRRAKLYEQSQQLAVKELEKIEEWSIENYDDDSCDWVTNHWTMELFTYIENRISALKKGEGK